MNDINKVTGADMKLIAKLAPYNGPSGIPLTFYCGDRLIKGVPDEFNPRVYRRLADCNMFCVEITGQNAAGLELRVEYTEYRDFPVTEWVAYITNRGEENTPVLSEIRIMEHIISGTKPVLTYGNGDTVLDNGYEYFTDPVDRELRIAPRDGLACHFAFPYMRLMLEEYGINIAVGWPAQWETVFAPCTAGVRFTAGQQRTGMYLKPGETIRTPRITLMGFSGDESRGRNIWRRWYFKHIIPRENGDIIPPKLCLHTWLIDGKPEFTGITEENQLNAIQTYVQRGLKPDIWWIDAGWYPCDFNWTNTGTWKPFRKQLPNGLGPVGEKCEKEGIQFLLWFEPERVREKTELDLEHPEWMLHYHDKDGNDHEDRLLNLADQACLNWLIEMVDGYIKEYHIHIYRQDFNFPPLRYWMENEEPGRTGMLENLHTQGYLRFWDELLIRNPGLWIDSCSSGGRRNDLETMRRAVPLHYTDIGYGVHPVKQKQHREMFEWIPYFRAHTMSWDNEQGDYDDTRRPVDEFAYHCAMAPAITSMIEYYDKDELFSVGKKMHPIWREAARLMISGDYYPLTECRKSAEDYYAMQFDDAAAGKGFIQVVRNTRVKEDSCTVFPFADQEAVYQFTDLESGSTMSIPGAELKRGFTVSIPGRSGILWFYRKETKNSRYL